MARKLLHDHVEQPVASTKTGVDGDAGERGITIAPWAAGLQFQSTSVSR